MLKKAQKLGGDPFEDTPKFKTNQAFMFIKPHANNVAVRALVKTALRENGITVLDEGEIDAVTILSRKLIDTHYGAIASKASLLKPVELNKVKGNWYLLFFCLTQSQSSRIHN